MELLEQFQNLKNDVLLVYKERYPYFNGTWKTFGSQDISNLIELIEQTVKQTVSEKWIYTHLKPETNEKLPRKDMLDILSQLVGFSGWDEYVFKNKEPLVLPVQEVKKNVRGKVIGLVLLLLIVGISAFVLYFQNLNSTEIQSFKVKDSYTNDTINTEDIKAVFVNDTLETPIAIINAELQVKVKDSAKIAIKSPFYKDQVVVVKKQTPHQQIVLKPDDYAMMLKAFMKSDIKDWQTRKRQLDKILSADLEVIVMLKNNLGAEYFNKQEFSEKLIVPSQALQKMKIIEIENGDNQQIIFIRIIQQ